MRTSWPFCAMSGPISICCWLNIRIPISPILFCGNFIFPAFSSSIGRPPLNRPCRSWLLSLQNLSKRSPYHHRHAADWVIRLGDGTDESHQRMLAAEANLAPYLGEMFEKEALAGRLADAAILPDPAELQAAFAADRANILARASLPVADIKGASAAAVRVAILKQWGICWRNCNICSIASRASNGKPQTTEQRALAVAAAVPDPEIPALTIADLGILRAVEIAEDGGVIAHLSPTYMGCPAVLAIELAVTTALQEAGFQARTERILSPPWITDWITEEGRRKMAALMASPRQCQRGACRTVHNAGQPARKNCPNSALPPARPVALHQRVWSLLIISNASSSSLARQIQQRSKR